MLGSLILIAIILYFARWIQLARLMPTIPGKLTPPIIGAFNTFKYLVDPPQFITEQVKKYGRIFKINSLINFMVIVTEPNAIAQIFKVTTL
jgi:hypothetical protein